MKTFAKICVFAMFASFLAGCSVTAGGTGEKTHFAFPNSNVTPLGQVKVEKVKYSIIFPRNFDAKDMIQIMNEAIAQRAGSDLIINYKADVTFTSFILPIYRTKFVLQGTAASMEIGQKDLLEKVKY